MEVELKGMELHTLYVCPSSGSAYMCGCDREGHWEGMEHIPEDCPERVVEAVTIPGGIDAAVDRLAGFMSSTEPYKHFHPENLKGHARRALEAACTATKEGQP